jgi:hypothetical protein
MLEIVRRAAALTMIHVGTAQRGSTGTGRAPSLSFPSPSTAPAHALDRLQPRVIGVAEVPAGQHHPRGGGHAPLRMAPP